MRFGFPGRTGVLALLLWSTGGSAQHQQLAKGPVPLGVGCFSTHTSGTGSKFMKVCFSNHGNIGLFESPSGNTFLVGREGYVACANSSGTTYRAYDAGASEGNWGPQTISQPNGPNKLPLTITRKTLNNWLELKQSFEIDPARYDVTITMSLKNTSGKTLSNVILDRYGDLDILPLTSDDYIFITNVSVFSWTNGGNYPAMSLSSASTEMPQSIFDTYANWIGGNSGTCGSGTEQPTPQGPNDWVARVSRGFGTLTNGTTKTIKVVYRRY